MRTVSLASAGVIAVLPGVNTTINNWTLSDNSFSNMSNPNMIAGQNSEGFIVFMINPSSKVDNLSFIGNSFTDINSGSLGAVLFGIAGTVSNLNFSDDIFTNINGNAFINLVFFSPAMTVSNFSVENCSFTDLNEFNGSGSVGINFNFPAPNEIDNICILNNSFTNINDTSVGINAPLRLTTPLNMNVLGNTFTGPTATSSGYATFIGLDVGGSLCLEFLNNTATPTSAPDPYDFETVAGIFNLTIGSDSSTNTGNFHIVGPVIPDSCTSTATCSP
jgi:hypothetical protein